MLAKPSFAVLADGGYLVTKDGREHPVSQGASTRAARRAC
jgi:hypothetical protein